MTRRQIGSRERGETFAARDRKALDSLLDGCVEMARQWSRDSADGRHRIMPDVSAESIRRMLGEPLPRRGASARTILAEVRRNILPFMRDNGSPRFFGYVMSPASAAGIAADLLTSALDQNVTAWRSAPAATEMERLVVDWMRRIVGLPRGAGGLLISGGSMATFTALAVARSIHAPADVERHGLGGLGRRRMMIYASEEIHMSVPRAAQLLGLGTDSVRTVPADDQMRIDTAALERAIVADKKKGHLPFCIAASAGTVNTGAVDPLPRLARIARKYRLWLHVDAAYGGPLGLHAEGRRLLAGIGEADSVTLDPHKWLYAPLDVGCVLFRNADAPRKTFSTHGEYAAVLAPGDRESYCFFDNGPELSRRFRALKVWMILKYHGMDRIGRRLREELALARYLGDLASAHEELELLAPVETSIVCFRYAPATAPATAGRQMDDLNREILLSLQRSGAVYLTNARVKGRFALRACLVNFRTTRADMRAVVEEVLTRGRRLSRALRRSR
jgi:glutamate/tyrosine decarboxylase-like PLP-dependent enzyme